MRQIPLHHLPLRPSHFVPTLFLHMPSETPGKLAPSDGLKCSSSQQESQVPGSLRAPLREGRSVLLSYFANVEIGSKRGERVWQRSHS